ncbi:hypothetical protein [Candidatus Tisiphia endosymbiont of Sialis lutaria]|uniref:hypothetical protein n=1 Tax=Candidatus Tisiphia endosymbiont of Sialis lutaria TaxID=2029164 RepID=UPI00312C8DF8
MTKSKNEVLVTAEEYQRSGEYYYGLAINMEDRNKSPEKIDASWQSAAIDFWFALILGSEKAPLGLFKCFGQGLGVKKDDNIAALMYGTALQFTPEDCANNIKDENKPVIAKSMQPRIDKLANLVKQAHAQIPGNGVTMKKVLEQMDKFNHAIKLPSGKLIQSCFTEKNTQANSKEKDLKSKTLELTKNLINHNKTLTTTNHISKKVDKVPSRIGCSIS